MRRTLAVVLASLIGALILASCSSGTASTAADNSADAADTSSDLTAFEWIGPPREMKGIKQDVLGDETIGGALVFTPEDGPSPRQVAVYVHQWMPYQPWFYEHEIRDLMELGRTVVFPIYQSAETDVKDLTPNLLKAISTSQRELDVEWRNALIVGTSTGAELAFNAAAESKSEGLIPPATIAGIDPGREPDGTIPRADLAGIEPSSQLITAVRFRTRIPGARQEARKLLKLATSVPAAQKHLVVESKPEHANNQVAWQRVLHFVQQSGSYR